MPEPYPLSLVELDWPLHLKIYMAPYLDPDPQHCLFLTDNIYENYRAFIGGTGTLSNIILQTVSLLSTDLGGGGGVGSEL